MGSETGDNLNQPKETSKGLPIIETDTIQALWQNYTTRESWGDHLEEVKQRMLDENPELVAFLESQVGKYPKELHTPMFEMVVGVVAVLESQAEANKLSQQFNSDNPTI